MEQSAGLAVRQTVTVDVPPERAFAVFTADLASWWPLESYHIGAQPAVAVVVEPKAGGRWYERAADGSECDWGRVLAWEPPHRVVLVWQISAEWQPDPGLHTEIEVSFAAEEGDRTRVELEHRCLEAYGERAQQMRDVFGSPDGWGGLLKRFAATAAEGER